MTMLSLSLEGKVALVTGGSKGIGRAIAIAYAEQGADVAIAARGKPALEETVKEIEKRGHKALAVPTDVGVTEQLNALHAETVSTLGGVDILVNNAAIFGIESILDVTQERFDEMMHINLWGALRLSQLCYPAMQKRGSGVILNVASNAGLIGDPGIGVYPPSKAAMINLSLVMAKEWGKDGIRVVSIAPGLVRTELAAELVDMLAADPEMA